MNKSSTHHESDPSYFTVSWGRPTYSGHIASFPDSTPQLFDKSWGVESGNEATPATDISLRMLDTVRSISL